MKRKKTKAWAIKYGDDQLYLKSISIDPYFTRGICEEWEQRTWKQCYKLGYRCVKVTIEECEDEQAS